MELSGVLPTTQFTYRKGLGTCDALLCVSHTLQSALESGQEARIAQINFSAAFDGVNHHGILYKLCSVGIGGSGLSILTQFLSNGSQDVMDHSSVLGPLLFWAQNTAGPVKLLQHPLLFWAPSRAVTS